MSNINTKDENKIKLRPYLSVTQCKYLVGLLSENAEPAAKSIHEMLRQTLLKYDAGFVVGSYTAKPRATLADKLGLQADEEARYLAGEMSEEEEASYLTELMKDNPI
jgi:hypothetical protein